MSQFDAKSTTGQVIEGISLAGKIAVVTGASSGLGVETTRVLAAAGAQVNDDSSSGWRRHGGTETPVSVTAPGMPAAAKRRGPSGGSSLWNVNVLPASHGPLHPCPPASGPGLTFCGLP